MQKPSTDNLLALPDHWRFLTTGASRPPSLRFGV